ncbi:hypothetical protein JCM11641_001517 [Rhodosporidiobolus odoratus]
MSALLDEANLDLASTPGLPPPAEAPPPPPPQLPSAIPTAQRARLINGVHTDVMLQNFADRIFVVVTQLGRIGCMIQISPPPPTLPSALPLAAAPSENPSILSSLPLPHPSTLLTPLFGVPPSPHISSLHDLYASQIGAIVFQRFSAASAADAGAGMLTLGAKPVVLGIALRRSSSAEEDDEGGVTEEERGTFAEVMEMVLECLS